MNPFETAEVYDKPQQAANDSSGRQLVSFLSDDQSEEYDDVRPDLPSSIGRKDSRVQKSRWGTQRHANGHHKNAPKRQHSLFRSKSSAKKSPPPKDQRDADDQPKTVERHIFFNMELPEAWKEPTTGLPSQDFSRNKIRTTKYTPLSFLPKNLYFQFRNVANLYFLLIVILGAFRIFGVASPGLAAVPIVVIVIVTAVKDAVEDYRRTLLDLEINNALTEVLSVPNSNVNDEKVSLWRRLKKATSHTLMGAGEYVQRKKAEKKGKKFAPRFKDLDNASVYSAEYPLEDLAPEQEMEPGQSVVDNNMPSRGARFQKQYWKSVKVGDFVRVRNDEEVPADIVIVATSESDGACYVETKNLDGETNLKVRQALRAGRDIKRASDAERASFWIESEGPMPNLYQYRGVARWQSQGLTNSEPLGLNNLLLRGCSLRNTEWVIGAVVYTGMDTKIMLNSGLTPTKRSLLQRSLNRYVIYNFAILFLLCFVSGLINGIKHQHHSAFIQYFEFGSIGGSPPVDGIVTFWAAVILYQSLVPISLYISIEIVKTCQAFFIYSDCYMYYDKIDYPCTPKSWNISDDLGQIEYVFSDKTGTLTQNVMEFRKCTVNGVAYGKAYTEAMAGLNKREGIDVEEKGRQMAFEIAEDKKNMIERLRGISDNPYLIPDRVQFVSHDYVKDLEGASGREQAGANYHFMLSLALCNSVITEAAKDIPGHKNFKAQSPDEAALVSAARDFGFALEGRTRRGVLVNVQGTESEYHILSILEFNSTRKRMSVIVKVDGRILLICKGADSIIYERLAAGKQQRLREATAVQLEEFASEGLRTLCIAQRELSQEQFDEWFARHERAAAAIQNREEQLEEVADSIERELTLLGGTAIEDRLQEGVPNTISLLAEGGIKLWVLTGDKVETAINIGFSCNLLSNDMSLLVIKVDGDEASVAAQIDEYLHKYFGMQGSYEELELAKKDHSTPDSTHAVVIDGDALKLALHPAIQYKFLLLCKQCSSVLCCRVSPAQKAAVVRMVRQTLEVVTLSIGDGANDVAMIQEADVGVGIAGEEGRQAVMSSDYAIGQFRFLSRLVLVHGRWSYKRLAEMIPNFFYKNVVFTFTLFWYGIFNDFDMSYLYDYTVVMFFNLAFTSLPVILLGIFDQDLPDKISLAVPQLYRRGIMRLDFNELKFWLYMAEGVYQSFIAFFFPYFVWAPGRFESMHGSPTGHRFWIGIACSTIAVFSANIYTLTNMYRWDIITMVVIAISGLLTFFWNGVYTSFVYSSEYYQAAAEVYGMLNFWAVFLLGFVTCIMPHIANILLQNALKPLDADIIREQWKLGEFNQVMANPQAADDPDTGRYVNPHRPKGKSTFSKTGGGRLKRLSRMSRYKDHSPYQVQNNSHTDILRSPSVVRVGNQNVMSERFEWDTPSAHNEPQEHTPREWARRSVDAGMRRSLDYTRETARYEQEPEYAHEFYTTQDIDELQTAEGLMRRSTLGHGDRDARGREHENGLRSPFDD